MFYRCFLDLGSQDVNWYRNSNPYFRLFLSADPSFWSQISRIKACMQYMQYMQYIEYRARASLHLKTRSRLCTYCKCYVLGAPVSAGVCCVLGAKASVFFRYPSEAGPPYRAIHVNLDIQQCVKNICRTCQKTYPSYPIILLRVSYVVSVISQARYSDWSLGEIHQADEWATARPFGQLEDLKIPEMRHNLIQIESTPIIISWIYK